LLNDLFSIVQEAAIIDKTEYFRICIAIAKFSFQCTEVIHLTENRRSIAPTTTLRFCRMPNLSARDSLNSTLMKIRQTSLRNC
jgi:hypothetical protein